MLPFLSSIADPSVFDKKQLNHQCYDLSNFWTKQLLLISFTITGLPNFPRDMATRVKGLDNKN